MRIDIQELLWACHQCAVSQNLPESFSCRPVPKLISKPSKIKETEGEFSQMSSLALIPGFSTCRIEKFYAAYINPQTTLQGSKWTLQHFNPKMNLHKILTLKYMWGPRGPQKHNGMTWKISKAAPVKVLRDPCGPRIFLLGLTRRSQEVKNSRSQELKKFSGLTMWIWWKRDGQLCHQFLL